MNIWISCVESKAEKERDDLSCWRGGAIHPAAFGEDIGGSQGNAPLVTIDLSGNDVHRRSSNAIGLLVDSGDAHIFSMPVEAGIGDRQFHFPQPAVKRLVITQNYIRPGALTPLGKSFRFETVPDIGSCPVGFRLAGHHCEIAADPLIEYIKRDVFAQDKAGALIAVLKKSPNRDTGRAKVER